MARHTRSAAALAALGLVASFGIAAADGDCYVAIEGDPTTTEDDVVACEEQHWFHRAETHGGNVGYVAPDAHGLATFDTNPPAGSVSGGNGGGYVATQGLGNDPDLLEAQFSGTFTGVLDRMDIDLHQLVSTEENLLGSVTIQVIVELNGAEIANFDEVEVQPVVEEASAAGSTRSDFAVVGLAEALGRFGPFFTNDVDTVHDITLKIRENWTDNVVVWAFDTTEVPGGITFNAKDIAPGTVVLDAS